MKKHLTRYTDAQRTTIYAFFTKLAGVVNITGTMSESKKIKIVQSWEPFPPEVVIAALEAYNKMDIPKAVKGAKRRKGENYVMGIIENKAADRGEQGGAANGGGDRSGRDHQRHSGADEGRRLAGIIGNGRTTAAELDCDF